MNTGVFLTVIGQAAAAYRKVEELSKRIRRRRRGCTRGNALRLIPNEGNIDQRLANSVVAGLQVVKDAVSTPDYCLAVAKQPVGKSNAGRETLPAHALYIVGETDAR